MERKPGSSPEYESTLLESGLTSLGIQPSHLLLESFNIYIDELLVWNKKTNLVGTHVRIEIITRHILDSLTVYDLLKQRNGSILDIGAGAGFPSLPLAIVDRRFPITAVERRRKRAAFLENMGTLLHLENFRVIQGDVNELGSRFDIILARAVGELQALYTIAKRVMKERAVIIAFKGKITEINKEMKRLQEKVRNDKDVHLRIQRVQVPHLEEEERNIVIIET
jgi:16S rRNA (guanine527-N7)-methyltransferase